MEQTTKIQVEELELMIGETDRRLGRERIASICGVKYSAITNWKADGVPRANRMSLLAYMTREDMTVPDWLVDVPVPSPAEADAISERRKQEEEGRRQEALRKRKLSLEGAPA